MMMDVVTADAAVTTAASEVSGGETPPADEDCSAIKIDDKTTQLRCQTMANGLSKG
jgi:hypothetical protein